MTINCKQNYPRCVGSRVHDTVTLHNYMKLKRMMSSLSHKLSYNYFGMSALLIKSYCPYLGNFKLIIILKLKLTPIVIPSCLSGRNIEKRRNTMFKILTGTNSLHWRLVASHHTNTFHQASVFQVTSVLSIFSFY